MGGVGAGVIQRGVPDGFEVLAPGLRRTCSLRCDADVGEEALLLGVELVVGGALVVQPLAELLVCAGEAEFGSQRMSCLDVCLSTVIDALPPQVPGRVPPQVEGVEGGGAFGR